MPGPARSARPLDCSRSDLGIAAVAGSADRKAPSVPPSGAARRGRAGSSAAAEPHRCGRTRSSVRQPRCTRHDSRERRSRPHTVTRHSPTLPVLARGWRAAGGCRGVCASASGRQVRARSRFVATRGGGHLPQAPQGDATSSQHGSDPARVPAECAAGSALQPRAATVATRECSTWNRDGRYARRQVAMALADRESGSSKASSRSSPRPLAVPIASSRARSVSRPSIATSTPPSAR